MAAAKAKLAIWPGGCTRRSVRCNGGLDPDLYKVEPYVTPGNVDGPDSPNFGRGGWTWYGLGGLAVPRQHRVAVGDSAGVRRLAGRSVHSVRLGKGFTVHRMFRGAAYRIRAEPGWALLGVKRTTVDGRELSEPFDPRLRRRQGARSRGGAGLGHRHGVLVNRDHADTSAQRLQTGVSSARFFVVNCGRLYGRNSANGNEVCSDAG